MYDNMSAKIMGFKKTEWSSFKDLLADNSFEFNIVTNSLQTREYLNWSNLRVEYYPNTEQVWIKNSLHVFFNDIVSEIPIGKENYNDFTIFNLRKTVEFLSSCFNRSLADFEIFGKIEYGVNINVSPYDPSNIIKSYVSISNTSINMFHAMSPKEGRVYGGVSYFTEYKFKVYNKTKQSNNQKKGIMRLECQSEVSRIKRVCNLKKITFEEIIKDGVLKVFKNDFMKIYNNISKLPVNQELKRIDMMEMLMISTTQGMDFDKKNLSRYKRAEKRMKYKSLMKQYSEDPKSMHYWIKSKIEKKLSNLIS